MIYLLILKTQEQRIDLFRACFTEGIQFDNEDDAKAAGKLRTQIENDFKKQASYIRGSDKTGRALLIERARTETDTQDDEFVASQIYLMERAIAATEFVSKGRQEKIVVVLDFGSFKSSLAPTLAAVKAVASILQTKYSERLKNLVVIDPPFWMRTMFGMIKPFLDPVTKAKFIVVTGDAKKLEVLTELIDADQAMPFMVPNGKLVEEVDLDRFTKVVPFHCLYDQA